MKLNWFRGLACGLVLLPALACAAAVVPPVTVPASVPLARSFDVAAKESGEAYRVKVFVPDGPAPVNGFPVVYVLDGNVLFGTFAGAARNEAQAGDIERAVVVGIENGEGNPGADRTFDFTDMDLTDHEKAIAVDLGPNPRFGGAEAFLRVIETEIKPRVAALVAIDPARQSLVGWSLGGLFVVRAMINHPGMFQNYVAISPSLWRSGRATLAQFPALARQLSTRSNPPRFFVAVGGREEELTPGMRQWKVDQTALAAEVRYAHMVGNARDLAGMAAPAFAARKGAFEFHVFEGETHNTVPWAAVNPVLRFLYAIQ
jgi:predicted alpha/beta superfamily hydrolase